MQQQIGGKPASPIGPDVSFYQDDNSTPMGVNFVTMKNAGASWVTIRAGQRYWIDEDFHTNWKNAQLAGIPRGNYWFYDSRSAPRGQAELWAYALDGDLGEMPLWCDFEDTYNGPYGSWKDWYDFIEAVKKFTNSYIDIGIYTAYYYWKERTAGVPSANLEYFRQYPLWIANYNTDRPLVPAPWSADEWTLWQYTDHEDGYKYGVESREIDMSVFNGNLQEFYKRFNIVPPQLNRGTTIKIVLGA